MGGTRPSPRSLNTMSRYRFALGPGWIISHLFVGATIVAMVFFGFWQLDRLDQRRDRNDRVTARIDEPVVEVLALGDPEVYESSDGADPFEFRRVRATGTYVPEEEVLVRSRSLNAAPGSWVLTPLLLDDGTAVAVNRGWIPNSGGLEAVPDEYRAPAGEVTVTGLVRPTEQRGSFGSTDPPDGVLTDLARADVERLDQQVEADLVPFYVQLQEQDPSVGVSDPAPVPAPELDEGPHLSYAVQWFTFSSMAAVVYVLILRKRARDRERELPGPDLVPEPR